MSGFVPGPRYRWTRRAIQTAVVLVLMVAPFLGGWQRLDRNNLSNWDGHGWDLPGALLDRLPLGDAPDAAYAANQLLGGGASTSLAKLPAVDPVAGLAAFLGGEPTWLLLLAWSLPLLLSIVAGRLFCGWLCPFGVLARGLDRILEWLPWRPRVRQLPDRRPVRWAALIATMLLGFFGFQTVIYLLLPHVMTQMTGYAFWLMGGGGAVGGWLLGLLLAGVVFGPTTCCAAVCPTGAMLSLGGHKRLISVYIEDLNRCGKRCDLCTRACWLQLDPASGAPGPDCDLCARCFATCPTTNLRIGPTPGVRRVKASHLVLILLASVALGGTAEAAPQVQPRLLLDQTLTRGDLHAALSLVDMNGVRLDADDPRHESGVELSLTLMRGPLPQADPRGKLAFRDLYRGPLEVVIERGDAVLWRARIAAPNYPRSTPRRRIYQARLDVGLRPDDSVRVEPITGWTPRLTWTVPRANPGGDVGAGLHALLIAACLFSGLLALAFAVPPRRSRSLATHPPDR